MYFLKKTLDNAIFLWYNRREVVLRAEVSAYYQRKAQKNPDTTLRSGHLSLFI